MYSRGAFNIIVLLLVVLVGSAVAQQLTGTQLLVSGSGPHAIGGGTNADVQLLVTGTFNGSVNPQALTFNTTSNVPANGFAAALVLSPTFNKAASGTHSNFSALRVNAPSIGVNAGSTVTDAASVYITGAPTGATNNYALWVAGGNARMEGNLRVTGDVQVDGNIAAKYQDVAEWVPSAHALAAGTVAIIDSRVPNRVVTSDKPYDTHVAGVVSTRPGVLLGEGGADKTKLAHSGRVKVKVDAQYGAIGIGDLLVTSATPGYAMRSEPINIGGAKIHRPGTIIGKALEPLGRGQGEILVLITLQ